MGLEMNMYKPKRTKTFDIVNKSNFGEIFNSVYANNVNIKTFRELTTLIQICKRKAIYQWGEQLDDLGDFGLDKETG